MVQLQRPMVNKPYNHKTIALLSCLRKRELTGECILSTLEFASFVIVWQLVGAVARQTNIP